MHRFSLFLLLSLLTVGGCAAYTATSGKVVLKDDTSAADVRFSGSDRAMIEDYFRKIPGGGSAASSVKLAKGAVVPSGVKAETLPRELEQKLSPLPSAYSRVRIGPDIVLVDRKTRIMVDVVYGSVN